MKIDITADGDSAALKLNPDHRTGRTNVTISAATWGGSTAAALEYSSDQNVWGPVREGDTAVSVTSNWTGSVEGDGFVRWTITSFSGTDDMKSTVN